MWSLVRGSDIHIDQLRDVSTSGARVVSEAEAHEKDEIRFDLIADQKEKLATGLARVVWCAGDSFGVEFLSLGIDKAIVDMLKIAPPPLPGAAIGGPPPLPGHHPQAQTQVVRPLQDVKAPVIHDPFAQTDEAEPVIEPLAVKKTGVIIGIDLGTTNTCASHVKDGRPHIIPGRTGTNTIPSMITFDPDGSWYVGQRAADRQILHPMRTVYGSKRLVGRTYRADIAAELQQHFAYPLGEADGQRFGVRIDDRVISMDTIAARVLDEVRSTAEAHLKQPVEAAVITVPAYFSEVQREAVRRAAKEANLVVHRIVNEPTAAAVAYGHKLEGKKTRVAVWDFGGGTFDFSVVQVEDEQLEVLASGGDNFVGGTDFDDLLASYLLTEFARIENLDLEPSPQQIARLRSAAEIAKRALSNEEETIVDLPDFASKRALRVSVSRESFEMLAQPLIDRTIDIANEVLGSIDLSPKDVDDVLLVGGTTRIPAVQTAVEKLFGRRPSKRINPDEAVALGAALLADEIGTHATLLDILPMTVGRGAHELAFVPIVERNARLPVHREVTVDADFMGSAVMPLFQGESKDVRGNEYLCTVIVEDRSLWDKGRVTFALSFDEHCVMAIEARDARTKRSLPVRLDRTRAIDDVLRELGQTRETSPPSRTPSMSIPPSKLGNIMGKLFNLFR